LPLAIGVALTTSFASLLQAQNAPSAPAPASEDAPAETLSAQELHELLAPIGLYPDALIALILPASTVPSDVVLAERYLAANGDPTKVDNQPWDDSVKSLVRYPDVLKWMDDNLEWTTSVGQAFVAQPADVMNAIQALRAEAKAKGNLKDTPQQRVVEEKSTIRIVPADPEVIYVPQYDPEIVYVQQEPAWQPLITFGVGFAVGSWLNYDCDWNRRALYRGNWEPGWNYDRGWREERRDENIVNVVNINNNTAQQWQPSANSRRQLANYRRQERANRGNPAQGVNVREGAAQARNVGRVPKPSRMNISQSGANKKNQRAKAEATTQAARNAADSPKNADKPKNRNRTTAPAPAPVVNQQAGDRKAKQDRPNKTEAERDRSKADRQSNRSKVPTAPAPKVDQAPKPNKQPRADRKQDVSRQTNRPNSPTETASKPKHAPKADASRQQSKTPKADRNESAAPAPQAKRPKNQGNQGGGQQKPRQQAAPQAQSAPKPQGNSQQGKSGGKGGGNSSDKKSNKKKNNND
jgi:hypothetical protein